MATSNSVHNLAQKLVSEMELQVFRNIQATILGTKVQKKMTPSHPFVADLFAQIERKVYDQVRKDILGVNSKVRTAKSTKTRVVRKAQTRTTVRTVEDRVKTNRDNITLATDGKYEVRVQNRVYRAARKRDLYRYVG